MNELTLPNLIPSENVQESCRRGAARLAQGDLAAARADFDRALEAAPDYPEAYNNRGFSRHALGDLARAIVDFDRAIELLPRYAVAFCNRGAARHAFARRGPTLLLQGKVSEAEQDFQEWLRPAPEWKDPLRLLTDEAKPRRAL